MLTEILVALISALGAVVAATVAAVSSVRANRKLDGVKKDARAVRDQVENDHSVNMRLEADHRHAETLGLFERVFRDVGGLRSEMRNLRDVDLRQTDRIDLHGRKIDTLDDKLDQHLTDTADLITYVRNKKEKNQ